MHACSLRDMHRAQLILALDVETEGGQTLYGKELNFKIHSTENKIHLKKEILPKGNSHAYL